MFIKKRQTISILLIFSIFLTLFTFKIEPLDAFASDLDNLQKQEQQLQKESQNLKKSIADARAKKNNQQIVQQQIDSQIDNTQKHISVLESRILLLNQNIEKKNIEITNAQADIDRNYNLFKKRLRAIYMTGGTTNSLAILLGSTSFSDLLTRAELLKRIADHDKKLLARLKDDKKNIEDAKSAILANKNQIESDRASSAAQKEELNKSLSQSIKYMNELKELENEYNNDFLKVQAAIKELDKKITAILIANQGSGQLSPGGWLWPAPGYYAISSGYGNRTMGGYTEFHLGIDIPTGRKSVPIVASKAGIVKIAEYHWSYGNYIAIDHGGGYSTLYAHNTSLNVSVGQMVAQGQVIAMSGTTGSSTGIHLHFEVRLNGKTQNPMNYLK